MNENPEINKLLNILSLEDSIRDYELICEQLTDAGYNFNITRVDKKDELIDLISRNRYDIILADFKLPEFDAFAALNLCNEICPDVPFICVSGSIGEETAIELIKQGAEDYVLKDSPKRLPSVIKRALDEVKGKEKRRLAEEALIVSESRYRRLFESAKDGILILNAETGKVIDVNPYLCNLLDYSHEQFIEKVIWEIGFFKDIIANQNKFLELQQKEYIRYEDLPLETANGREINVEFISNVYPVNHRKVIQCNIRDITERKLIEDSLRKSEELFKNLFQHHAAVKLIIDPDSGNILDANDAAVNYYGWAHEQITHMKIQDINTLTPEEIKAAMEKVKNQKKIHFEFRHRRADGSVRDVEIFSSSIKVQGKDILHSIIYDITERKKAEENVKKLNRTYAVLSEINKAIVRINDQQELFEAVCSIAVETGEFRFCWIGILDNLSGCVTPAAQCGFSDGFLEDINVLQFPYNLAVCGHSETAFITGVNEIYNDIEHDERTLPWREKALNNGYCSSASFSITRSETVYAVIYFYSSQAGFFDEEEIKLLEELSNDISFSIDSIEREKQKQNIKQERDRLFNYSIDMMCIIGFDGYFKQLNPAWEKTLGWTNEELMAKPYTEFVHTEDKISTAGRINKAHTGKQLEPNFLNRFLCKDGTYKWLSWNSVPVAEENLIFTVVRDVTTTIKNENERKSLEAQLVQAQKLESLGTLAGGIAHDFNNILNIIMGYASILKMPDCNQDELLTNTDIILDASKRGAELIKQLLIFARKSESVFYAVQVNSIISEISKLLRETFPKKIEINCELQEDLPLIIADSTQIHQIFLNLCVNARDAMQQGGILTITTRRVSSDVVILKNPMAGTGGYIEIQVSDTGTGIDETIKQKIFDPFFTTKESGKGTGLGLALVYGIIKNHEGFIDLTSEPGNGTTFYIYLPAQEHAAKIYQAAEDTDEDIPKGTGTVLLIEDEKQYSEILTTTLVLNGYKVITAYDGLQGIAAYQTHKNEIKVIICDLGLPRLDGEEVFKQIKAMNPDAGIIIISGFIDPETKARLFEAGARYIINKPFIPEKILKTIRDVTEEK